MSPGNRLGPSATNTGAESNNINCALDTTARCRRCKRRLWAVRSLAIGHGRVCHRKVCVGAAELVTA